MTVGYGPDELYEPEPPRHGSGWRFLSFAAGLLVVLPVVSWNGPGWYDDLRQARNERQYQERLKPARAQVARMRPPAGATSCQHTTEALQAMSAFCWNQPTTVARAVQDLLTSVTQVGGRVEDKECVRDPAGDQACVVYAVMDGAPFTANVWHAPLPGRQARQKAVRVSGGLDCFNCFPKLFERTLPGQFPDPIDPNWWGWTAPSAEPEVRFEPVLPVPSPGGSGSS